MEKTFGRFIEEKRLEKGISLRQFALMLDITPSYMSDIEKGRRNAPEITTIEEMVRLLGLTEQETNDLYELAGKTKKDGLPPDLPEFIAEQEKARVFLRTAKKYQISEEKWEELIKDIQKGE